MSTKAYRKYRGLLIVLCAAVLVAGFAGCDSDQAEQAAKPRSRAVINAGEIVPAEEVRVAEYLQYYDQHFPEPQNSAVGLDLRLGNSVVPSEGGMVWLQIGLQTKSDQTESVSPLNLAIVIDRSGSMADDDKMPYLKQSLNMFLQSLNSNDIVAVVTYNDRAEVLVPAQMLGSGHRIQQMIDSIQPGGATNLHAGMMLGFEEVNKNYDIRRNNRVILLTDGIANRGITDPQQIAVDALAYNNKGIYLGTIGLGLEFNDSLLSQLADQGQGGYTFVDSTREMERIFREHVSGLTQRVASDVEIKVIPQQGVRLVGLTGFKGSPPTAGASIPLWPLGTGDSAVVLAELQAGAGSTGYRPLATVELEYFDEFAQRTVSTRQTIGAEMVSNMSRYNPTWDLEIYRNVTIQRTAEAMKEIDRLFDGEKYEEAWRIAVDLEQQLNEVASLTGDSQISEDAALMRKYQQTLAEAVWQMEGRSPWEDEGMPQADYNDRPYRGYTPTPNVPEIKID